MTKKKKLLLKILSGSKNISFSEVSNLLISLGFSLERIQGSHHIFYHHEIQQLVNIQNVNGQVKPYQLKQIIRIIEKFNLKIN